MKISKAYLGKMVMIQWRDPNFKFIDDVKELERGRKALATWQEFGKVYDISEGIVMVMHSASWMAGKDATVDILDGLGRTAIDEGLIESITVYEPGKVEAPVEAKP